MTDNGENQHVSRLAPGVIVRHRDGDVVRLRRRKDDDSGWWLEEAGGISDDAMVSGDWFFVAESLNDLVTRFSRAVLSDIEARNPGIDPDEVEAYRNRTSVIGGTKP